MAKADFQDRQKGGDARLATVSRPLPSVTLKGGHPDFLWSQDLYIYSFMPVAFGIIGGRSSSGRLHKSPVPEKILKGVVHGKRIYPCRRGESRSYQLPVRQDHAL